MKKGKFIVLEGIDGSGKTTIINMLKTEFPNYIYSREPGGSEFGEMVRAVLLDERSKNVPPLPILLGFMSSRASHVQELVSAAIKRGKNVVSDRFDASTFAFQLYGGQNKKLEKTFWFLRKEILKDISVEYIYLRITPKVAEDRRKERTDNNHFDNQKSAYHKRVFNGYENFFKKINKNYHVVDASLDKNDVYNQVLAVIQKILKKK